MRINTPPQKTDKKRRAWIKYQLEMKGYSLASLGLKHGLSRSCVRQAFVKPYPKMERLIAHTLGLRPEEIWPERYIQSHGNRRRKRGQ